PEGAERCHVCHDGAADHCRPPPTTADQPVTSRMRVRRAAAPPPAPLTVHDVPIASRTRSKSREAPPRFHHPDPATKTTWTRSAANEFGRLANGVGGRIKQDPTSTIKFIPRDSVPSEMFQQYGKFECQHRPPEIDEPNHTRLTIGRVKGPTYPD
ncbi:hypothetical protein THAOC_27429, partial [Thalassiosira oceanica]